MSNLQFEEKCISVESKEMKSNHEEDSPLQDGMTSQLDNILEKLGGFGRFQILNCFLIFIPLTVSAWFGLSFVFTVNNTPHRCYIPQCETGEFDAPWISLAIPSTSSHDRWCKRYSDWNEGFSSTALEEITCHSGLFDNTTTIYCDQWVYSDNNTIVSEFNLACQEWKTTLIGTTNSIGQLFGLPLTGILSDKFGRRNAMTTGVVMSALAGTIRSFSPDYWTYLVLEFIDGCAGAGIYPTGFILCVEFFGPKHRILVSSLISYSYAVGEVLLGIIAWLFPYWRTLLRVLYIPTLLLVNYIWMVPESVRWLLSKHRFEDANVILRRIAKFNKVDLCEKSMMKLLHSMENEFPSKTNIRYIKREHIFLQLLKSKIMLIRVAFCSFWWITCTFVYFGLSLNSVSISGNMYLNFILVSFIEVPGYFLYYYIMDRIGRRWSLCLSLLGSGGSCFIYLLIPPDILWLQLLTYMFGKFAITVAFTVLYVYASEIFPTPLRASLIGTCSMFGRLGSIVAPQAPLLGRFYGPLPLLLFGFTSVVSGFTILGFPETNNIKLPDTIEEAEQISKKKPITMDNVC